MCALLSGLFIRGDHEGGGLAKEGKKCVFKRIYSLDGLAWNLLCLFLDSPMFNWWFSFASIFKWCCRVSLLIQLAVDGGVRF